MVDHGFFTRQSDTDLNGKAAAGWNPHGVKMRRCGGGDRGIDGRRSRRLHLMRAEERRLCGSYRIWPGVRRNRAGGFIRPHLLAPPGALPPSSCLHGRGRLDQGIGGASSMSRFGASGNLLIRSSGIEPKPRFVPPPPCNVDGRRPTTACGMYTALIQNRGPPPPAR